MPTIFTFISIFVSLLVALFILPYWIRRAKEHNLVGKDMHKPENGSVAELGGLVVIFSAVLGILSYVAFNVFVYKSYSGISLLMASATSVFIASIIGLFDDLLGWKLGLRQYQKLFLTFLIALPIMVVNAGVNNIQVPFFGYVDFGLLFPLFIIPIGIVGASNAFNMLAGFNGLEAGLGVVLLSSLGFISFMLGEHSAAIISACFVASLIVFLAFNRYPAQIFPGDVMTLSVGAVVAIVAIFGNIELYALLMFVPLYGLEFFLKARGGLKKESFGRVTENGLDLLYDKIYGVTHFFIWFNKKFFGKATETSVVYSVLLAQFLISGLVVLYFLARFNAILH